MVNVTVREEKYGVVLSPRANKIVVATAIAAVLGFTIFAGHIAMTATEQTPGTVQQISE